MRFTRYMLGNFFRILFLVLLGMTLLFVVIDFVGNIRMWLNRGLQNTGEYYLNYLPYIVYLVLPIAILIAVIGSLGNMARHLELTAFQGAGISGWRMLAPLLLTGGLLSLGMFAMGETILPDANHRRLELFQPNSARASQRIKEKSNFAFISSTRQSWYFQHYSALNRRARQVILLRFENGRVMERYDAQQMLWNDAEQHWQMLRGFYRRFLENGNVITEPFESRILDSRQIFTRPEDIIHSRQSGDEMSASMIHARIRALKRSGEETRVLETQWHFKFSGPMVALITLLIGTSLAHRYSRSGGISQKFGIGLLLSFSYYVTIKVGLQMGEGGVLSPWLGAWIGNILFGLFALVLMVRSFKL